MVVQAGTITELYVRLLQHLYNYGKEYAPRDMKTKELIGVSTELYRPYTRCIVEPLRKHSISYLVHEFKWYLSGEYDVEYIGKYAPFWKKLADENNEVNSNYGAKLFYYTVDGKTQFEYVVDELKRDEYSRRAIFYLNLFPRDYRQMHDTKDFPCTVYAQALIRDGSLDLVVSQRSCDVVKGFCYDQPIFSLFQEMLARMLEVDLGILYYYYGSLHIYEDDFEKLEGASFDFDGVRIKDEIPFFPMTKTAVLALLDNNFEAETSFHESIRKYL